MKYKEYTITQGGFMPYEFSHEDYDGAPDAYDPRRGWAYTLEEAMEIIDDIDDGYYCEYCFDTCRNCHFCCEIKEENLDLEPRILEA